MRRISVRARIFLSGVSYKTLLSKLRGVCRLKPAACKRLVRPDTSSTRNLISVSTAILVCEYTADSCGAIEKLRGLTRRCGRDHRPFAAPPNGNAVDAIRIGHDLVAVRSGPQAPRIRQLGVPAFQKVQSHLLVAEPVERRDQRIL